MDFHTQDWANSGVHPDIIDLNVRSIYGIEAFELLYGRSASAAELGPRER